MKINNPLRRGNLKPILTSGYMTPQRPMHNGSDYCFATKDLTYGADLVNPFNEPVEMYDRVFSEDRGGSGNFARFKTVTKEENGQMVYYGCSFSHCSEINEMKNYLPGEVAAKCGNSGEVYTIDQFGNKAYPSPENPKLGSHIHFVLTRCREVVRGAWTCDTLDPELYIEKNVVPVFTRTLRFGSFGVDVKLLQEILKGLGLFVGSTTYFFGPITKRAVIDFQTLRGLVPDGVVGPKTIARL